jgi:hypothetical protein
LTNEVSRPPYPVPDHDTAYLQLTARILDAMAAGSLADDHAFNALALEIHAFQRCFNSPYAAFCGKALPADWREIPAVPTEAFKNARVPLVTFPITNAIAAFKTSGTTTDTRGIHHFFSLDLYEASVRQAWRSLALPALPCVALSLPPSQAPESSLIHMFDVLGCEFVSGDDIETLRNLNEPALLMGTALAFVALFEHGDFPLPPGSLAMETGGYKGSGLVLTKPELYSRFEKHLCLPSEAILNEYSMTELSSQFYTRSLNRAHHGPPWTRVRIVDPESGREVDEGETGILIIHDLANLGSAAALTTRDLAIRRPGHTFELLGRDPSAPPRGCSLSARDYFPL